MSTTLKYCLIKTRKDHNCHGCARLFEKGSKLYSVSVVDEGIFSNYYICKECRKYSHTIDMSEFEDDFFYGCFLEDEEYKLRLMPLERM